MAKMTFQGLNEVISQEVRLRDKTTQACKYTLFAMADVYADAIKAATHQHDKTGALANSLYVHKMYEDGSGYISTYISFEGYDSKGTPNPLKANILESGTSNGHVEKTHFFTNAIKSAKATAEAAASAAYDDYTSKLIKE